MKSVKMLMVAVLTGIFLLSCGGGAGLSKESQTWLKDYEVVVDEYLTTAEAPLEKGEQGVKLSEELEQKLSKLSIDAEKIRKEMKPGEALLFLKEFGRITTKLSVGRMKKTAVTNL